MKSRSGKTSAALSALIIIAVTLAGFGLRHLRGARSGYQGEQESISIGAISYDKNALIFIAEARNFFADNCVKVTLKDYDTGSAAPWPAPRRFRIIRMITSTKKASMP